MGTFQPWRAHATPGRLVANPTQEPSSGTFPYGGRELGSFSGFAMRSLGEPFVVEDEIAGAPDCILEPSSHWTLGVVLNGVDDDAQEILFPGNAEPGSRTRRARFDAPGRRRPGESAENRAVRLLFVPDALSHHRGVMVYRGFAFLADGAEIRFGRDERQTLAIAVHCLPDASSRVHRWALLRDVRL